MISCKKATELISRSLEESLSIKEELLLKMHLFLCETCDLFRKQTALLRRVVRRSEETLGEDDSVRLSEAANEENRKKLDSTPD